MATTSIWAVKKRLDHVIDYAVNPDKTTEHHARHDDLGNVLSYATQDEKVEFVTGLNCIPEYAKEQMQMTKQHWNKTGGILAFHAYQSFKPGEATPELAHAAGVEFARRMWGDRFQVVVATHTDKNHLHNHFVINSVSFVDGKKYYDNKDSYYNGVRALSDQVCREFGLSVIEHPKGKGKHYKEAMDEKAGKPTPRNLVKADVNEAIEKSPSFKAFVDYLEHKGYEVKHGPRVAHIAVRPIGSKDFFRLYKLLGEEYEESGIRAMLDGLIPIPAVSGAVAPTLISGRDRVKHSRPRQFKLPREHKRHRGIVATYYKYLYMLGKVGNRRMPNRVALPLRRELRKAERYKKQFHFLYDNKIETDTQLGWYADALQSTIDSIVAERKPLYKALKQAPELERPGIAAQIDKYNSALRVHRGELRLCQQIERDLQQVDFRVRETETVIDRMGQERAATPARTSSHRETK